MTTKIKGCPFCGGSATLDRNHYYRRFSTGELSPSALIQCEACYASMQFCYSDFSRESENDVADRLIDDWNKRQVYNASGTNSRD